MAVIPGPPLGAAAGVTGSLWDLQISGNTLGTTGLVASGTLSLNAGTNITLSQSATNKITILGPANVVSAAVISGNTSGTTASVSSGTMVLSGGTNITLSQNAQTIEIIGANTGTMSVYQPSFIPGGMNARQFGQSSVHLDPVMIPNYVSATRADVVLSCSVSTSSNSSWAATLSYIFGIYTKNVSTLSLASSGGTVFNVTNTAAVSFSSLHGVKYFSIPININMTPGNYWFAHHSITTSGNTNWYTMSNFCAGGNVNSGLFGGASTGTFQYLLGMGHFSVQTAAFPNAIGFTDIANNSPNDLLQQWVAFHAITV